MPIMSEEEFNRVYPHGSYGGYLAGCRDRAKWADPNFKVPEFDVAGFVAAAVENQAAGYCND